MGPPIGLTSSPALKSSSVSTRWVTWTVVSVMPYMLTSSGEAVPCRSTQPRSRPRSSASPPKMIRRRVVTGSSACRSASMKRWNADGVWLSTVTPRSRTRRWKSTGERVSPYSGTSSSPPCASAPQSSQTAKSKEKEWNWTQTSDGPKPMAGRVFASSVTTLECGTATPLGRPVDPEV
ncbi:hypothetical protein SALBM135S_05395 [Streptomyces alboniger]